MAIYKNKVQKCNCSNVLKIRPKIGKNRYFLPIKGLTGHILPPNLDAFVWFKIDFDFQMCSHIPLANQVKKK